MHSSSTPRIDDPRADTEAPRRATTTLPTSAAAAFTHQLDVARRTSTDGRLPPRPLGGDIDEDGELSGAEKLVLAMRNMIDKLQEQLVLQVGTGALSEHQRQRITAGIKALSMLVANTTAAIENGEDIDEGALRKQMTDIVVTATSNRAPEDDPVPHVASREEVRIAAELAARFEVRVEAFLHART